MQSSYQNRLEVLLHLLSSDLGQQKKGTEVAKAIQSSQEHSIRLFEQTYQETPKEFRKRLTLERAAYTLSRTEQSITSIALDAGYASLEAFTRAFRKAFQVTPTAFRATRTPSFWLPTENGIHFAPGTLRKEAISLDLIDLLFQHDFWLTRKMLEAAEKLPPDQLDRQVGHMHIAPYYKPAHTLREMLDSLIADKEAWLSALHGQHWTEDQPTTLPDLKSRTHRTYTAFLDFASTIKEKGEWNVEFVDAVCTPPETFTFKGILAHVITFSAIKRQHLLDAFRVLGVDLGSNDPIEFERL
ncbi:helix-turn-helix transcriptional regulator [Deinococcus roseus]|uniref:AraC family transcriptional regulator n=1 Tax=Deinococcus roseus TaxID=392414 RepID=A0ABQ2CWU1_9DEIO|nr:AraC family transcriptional regulator [Deinococcus roseus]GGJ21849.1 AraC family transcriptional regulator [Deinococcus roseus]